MPHDTRRDFLSRTARAVAAIPLGARLGLVERLLPREPAPSAVSPFPLADVRLHDGPFLDALHRNNGFMMGLPPERLLHNYRVNAGLPSSAEPLGGWEAPNNELRGHFVGHYLSACALQGAQTGDSAVRERGTALVAELAKCQQPNGYLSAFPEEFFDRLREGRSVWAPFYTLHKIMAGLLDSYTLSGNQQALTMVQGMARWTAGWCGPLGDSAMQRVLEREYGGMNEVLYNLSAVTGNDAHRELAHRFDHERIFAPLAAGRDELKGLHVNTNIPKIIGAARRYELTGEQRSRDIAEYFWWEVTSRRAYATGGTSDDEGWSGDPGKLAGTLSGYTQECCTTHNMLKLARHLFTWSADPRIADYYERAMWNGIMGTQDPETGTSLYYVPLVSGLWKLWGVPYHDFWCCTGTGTESFSKLGDSIYFHDDVGIYVNQFVASEVQWKEKGLRLVQDTRFPDVSATRLTVFAERPTAMQLRLRVPYWIAPGGGVKLNGRPLEAFAAPGSYFVLNRTWKDGDTVEMTLPMRLHVQPMPDDPTIQAIMYGPMVLVGRLGKEGLTPEMRRAEPTPPREVPKYRLDPVTAPSFVAKSDDPADWVKPVAGTSLEFRTVGQAHDVSLAPFHRVLDERYAVYWRVGREPG